MAEHALPIQAEYHLIGLCLYWKAMCMVLRSHLSKKDKDGAEDAKHSNRQERIIVKSVSGIQKSPILKGNIFWYRAADASQKWIITVLGLSTVSPIVPFLISSVSYSMLSHPWAIWSAFSIFAYELCGVDAIYQACVSLYVLHLANSSYILHSTLVLLQPLWYFYSS